MVHGVYAQTESHAGEWLSVEPYGLGKMVMRQRRVRKSSRLPDLPIVPVNAYVDDFGQMKDGPTELALVAALIVPANYDSDAIIGTFVGGLRERIHGHRSAQKEIKAKMWLPDEAQKFASLVESERWGVVRVPLPNHTGIQEELDGFARAGREQIAYLRTLPAYADETPEQKADWDGKYEAFILKHPRDFACLAQILYGVVTYCFERWQVIPEMQFTLDRKLSPDFYEIADHFAHIILLSYISERWKVSLNRLCKGRSLHRRHFVLSTDDECDGLVLADALAHMSGMVEKGRLETKPHWIESFKQIFGALPSSKMEEDADINHHIEEIDQQFIQEGVPVSHRSWRAMQELAKRLQRSLIFFRGVEYKAVEAFYEQRYGGSGILMPVVEIPYSIEGEIYFFTIPIMFNITVEYMRTFDATQCLKAPEQVIKRLKKNEPEYAKFKADFEIHMGTSRVFGDSSNHLGVEDYREAVDNLKNGRLNHAVWSTVQCAEKALKSVLQTAGVAEQDLRKLSHNLRKAHLQAVQFEPLFQELTEEIETCFVKNVDFRYESKPKFMRMEVYNRVRAAFRIWAYCGDMVRCSQTNRIVQMEFGSNGLVKRHVGSSFQKSTVQEIVNAVRQDGYYGLTDGHTSRWRCPHHLLWCAFGE